MATPHVLGVTIAGFDLNGSVALLGVITGMTYGILAVGLVLVYRSNRIVNFAHGEIGALAAGALGVAVVRWNFPYWVAFVLALGIGGGVGAMSEVVVVRRLKGAPPLMSIVATLGLAQFLVMFTLAVNSQASAGSTYPQPSFVPEFSIGSLRISRAYAAMLFVTPLVVAGLAFFLRRSRFGLAIRATAANSDKARLSGVYAGNMSTASWAIAGAVSAFTAILVLPTRGFASAQLLGPGLLLRALAAAVIARMVSLPVALVAGIGVGVFEQLVVWNHPGGGVVEIWLFVILLVALLAQRRQGGRDEEKGSWAAVQPWPPLPEAFQRVWLLRNLGIVAGGVALALALAATALISNATAITLVTIMCFTLVGLSLSIVTGLGGQLSLGQFALAGVGAAASYAVTEETGNFILSFLAATVTAGLVAVVIGLPALRIRGLMLAVTTLSFALAAQTWLFSRTWMFGDGVLPGKPVLGDAYRVDTGRRYYVFALLILALGFLIARNIWRSGFSRALRAVRDNEDAARAFTVGATRVKLQAFGLGGMLAGLGGALFCHLLSRVSLSAFPISSGIDVAASTVLGGIGVLAGPLIGAAYIIGVPKFLPLDNAGLAATAAGWLVLILYFPGGIAQLLRPARDRLVVTIARAAGVDADDDAVEDDGRVSRFTASMSANGGAAAAPAAAGVLLDVSGLAKSYGGLQAVDNATFQVEAGETLGLMGPNGAGKTTLFELVSGFTRPDEGRIAFAGRDITAASPEARGRLGLIRSFQDASLFATLTVSEVVMLAHERAMPTSVVASFAGWQAPERRKAEQAKGVMAAMGLEAYRSKRIAELSTGTRRIVELACVVALRPSLLLLDEPSSGIAQRESEALGALLRQLKDRLGMTLVIIEHDIPLLMGLADRVIAMDAGRIIAVGSPAEVRADPAVVEAYLGVDTVAIERSQAPVIDEQCAALTRSGARCMRPAGDEGYCTQHRSLVGGRA